MRIITGDLWSELGKADLLLVTINCVIKRDGTLTMGAGAAKEAAERCPELPRLLAEVMNENYTSGYRPRVLVPASPHDAILDGTRLGGFVTKRHWRHPSDLDLIGESCWELKQMAAHYDRVALNLPGCGLGGLTESQVLPLLAPLPDNVFIYRRNPALPIKS